MAFFDFEVTSFYPVELVERVRWCGDTWEVFFPRPFDFVPGQLCALHCGDPNQARLYSIASSIKSDQISVLFKLVSHGLLTPRLSTCELGTLFYLSPPFGKFILDEEKAIWVATGTGIAPFLCAARSRLDLSNKALIQGARSVEAFLAQEIFKTSVGLYVPCCSFGATQTAGQMYSGRLTSFLREWSNLDLLSKFYLCGSSQMIVDVREILVSRGVELTNIICEVYF